MCADNIVTPSNADESQILGNGRNHRFLEASMCLPKWAKRVKKPPLASVSEVPSRASARSRVPGKNSLESWTTLNSTHNSKDSSKSTDSASSLTNIREMLSDGPIIFKYRDLSKVTDNFNASRKVGSGVYRGSLQKTDIAIVVETRGGAGRENFVSEIKNLGSVHHANLVRLLGGCINGDQVYLVYDYISGGNLHQCLHSNLSPGFSVLPSWLLRVRVALEISTGLEYLHHHLIRPTVHKHIKSSNILLDTDLHVKIAFFGVAQIRGETGAPEVKLMTQSMEGEIREHINEEVGDRRTPLRGMKRFHSIKFTGTHGYMAPEYVNGGIISSKLDVFAFGVILLELLSGQKAVTFETIPGGNRLRKTLLSEVIISLFAENDPKSRIRAWIDPLLKDEFPVDCAVKAAKLAKGCVDPVPSKRPDMSQVSMTLLQIQMSSNLWNDKMKATKDLLTSALHAR